MSEGDFVFLVAEIPGVLALDRNKNIVASATFPREPEKILEGIENLEKGEETEELEGILEELEVKNIVTDLPLELEDLHVETKDKISAREHVRKNMRAISKEIGFAENDQEFNEIIRDVQIIRTREEIKSSVEKDKVLGQAVSALGDIRSTCNELSERLQEWYGLYYPEFEAESNEKYAELVAKIGRREEFNDFKGSMGIDLEGEDVEILQQFGEEVDGLFQLRDNLKSYLEDVMPDIAPNMTHVIGAEMTAKLISLAGSLEDIAKMPSSKIQLLGAEKALFRHLKGGGKPPKYGIIYNHPYIQRTQEDRRGKVARAIASKLMMAARTDFYTDDFKGEKYKEELEEKIEDIRGEG